MRGADAKLSAFERFSLKTGRFLALILVSRCHQETSSTWKAIAEWAQKSKLFFVSLRRFQKCLLCPLCPPKTWWEQEIHQFGCHSDGSVVEQADPLHFFFLFARAAVFKSLLTGRMAAPICSACHHRSQGRLTLLLLPCDGEARSAEAREQVLRFCKRIWRNG